MLPLAPRCGHGTRHPFAPHNRSEGKAILQPRVAVASGPVGDVVERRILIRLPLRQAVLAGKRVEADRPVCKMRFTPETDGQFDQTLNDPAPKGTVNFAEAL